MATSDKRGVAFVVLAVAIAVLVLAAALGVFVYLSQLNVGSLSKSLTSSISSGENPALARQCSQTRPPSGFLTLRTNMSEATLLCLRVYYYNSTSPLTLNLSQAITIQASQAFQNGSSTSQRFFSGAANFTVVPSQSEITIGGPNKDNEGTIVAYSVTAKSAASGTYWLAFFKSIGAYDISSGFPSSCSYNGVIVAGNGQPDYSQYPGSCIDFTSSVSTDTTLETISGAAFPLPDGNVYFEVVGIANSTTSSPTT